MPDAGCREVRSVEGQGVAPRPARVNPAARRLRAALVALALTWATSIVVAPAVRAARPGTGVAVAAALPYVVGARICHQRPERSFHTHGVAWPVCGRCAALYLSGAAALLVAAGAGIGHGGPSRGLLLATGMPTLATWGLEVAGLWNPGTIVRALAAVPLGLVLGLALHAALRSTSSRQG